MLYGYSEAFGNDVGAGLIGNPFEAWGLKGLFVGSYTGDAIAYPLSEPSLLSCSSRSRPRSRSSPSP